MHDDKSPEESARFCERNERLIRSDMKTTHVGDNLDRAKENKEYTISPSARKHTKDDYDKFFNRVIERMYRAIEKNSA